MHARNYAARLDPAPRDPLALLKEAVRMLAGEGIYVQGPYPLQLLHHPGACPPEVSMGEEWPDLLDRPEDDVDLGVTEVRFRLFGDVMPGVLAAFLVAAAENQEEKPLMATVVVRNTDLFGLPTAPDFRFADAPSRLRDAVPF